MQEQKEITKQSKSSFLYSFSLLSKEKNDAINTIYAFCRKTDDIVDNTEQEPELRQSKITEWREELKKALANGNSKYNLLNKVKSVRDKFSIPEEPFFDLIRGMEMDLTRNRYDTFEELSEYCYNVASSVGLMSIAVFGYSNSMTKDFAVNLGIALQLTNIIRDVKQDAELGRIYIPAEDMRKFDYTEDNLLSFAYDERFINLMKYECARAKEYYRRAETFLSNEDKGSMFPARIMQHIYFRILGKIESRNYNVFSEKVGLSNFSKALIAAGVYLKYAVLYGTGGKEKLAFGDK